MKHITLTILYLSISTLAFSQIFINEFMASNENGITDNYGEYEDWIEIYNSTSTAYNLAGLYFTDDNFSPALYQIPFGNDSTIVPAGGYLILWADDDTEQGVLHLGFKLTGSGEEIGIFDGIGNPIDTTSYTTQGNNVSMGRSPDGSNLWVYYSEPTPESSNLTTYLSPHEISVNIPHTNNYIYSINISANVSWNIDYSSSWLTVDPTSGTNNGSFTITSIQENNTGSDRTTTITLSGSGVNNQEVIVTQYPSANLSNIVINELMASNDLTITDNYGEYDDWIEIYNKGFTSINIGGMYITDDFGDPTKFQITNLYPDSTTIEPDGFLLFWADDDTEQGVYHLNFKLSNNGEEVALYQNEFTEIDNIIFGAQDTDVSYGRTWDGGSPWQTFTVPTPGYSNSLDIEETEISGINIYPNPADDIINIDLENNSQNMLSVYNISGKLLITDIIESSGFSLNVSRLPAGVYLIKIISKDKIFTEKIFIN